MNERPSLEHQRLFDAAIGWLGLGNWWEANEELENLPAELRASPQVFDLRCQIYAQGGCLRHRGGSCGDVP